MKRWAFTTLIFFHFFSALANAGQDPRAQVEKLIRELRLEPAERMCMSVQNAGVRNYYLTKIRFFKVVLTDDKRYVPAFDSSFSAAVNSISTFPADADGREALLAEMYLARGAVRFLQGRTVMAALDLRKACDLASGTGTAGSSAIHCKVKGIFQVALSSVPQNLKWLGSFLCAKGDLQEGIRLLETASKESPILPEEAEVVLFYLEKNFLGEPEKAVQRISRLISKDPGNYAFNFLYALACFETGRNEEALKVLSAQTRWNQDADIFKSPLWDLFLGRAYYYKLEYNLAASHFSRFIAEYRGESYLADAWFKKGLCQLFMGQAQNASISFRSVLSLEESGFDSDGYSRAMAEKYTQNLTGSTQKKLWQSRALFDGGYFNRSLDLLYPLSDSLFRMNKEEKAELYYRFGRNYFALGNMKLAKMYFHSCIDLKPVDNLWLSAYSAFYLGKVAEKNGNYTEAKMQYEKVFSYDDYYYQSGLETKTKTALSVLEEKMRASGLK